MQVRYAAAVVVACLVLAGCGPSDGELGSDLPPSSPASVATPTEPSASPEQPTGSASAPNASATPSAADTIDAPDPAQSTADDPALAALGLLAVKGRAPMTGYDRARFGQAWLDADRNGCDTRNDVLAERLRAVVLESNGCVVATGQYADPYTGATIDYRHGDGTLIDIDHVVALGNSWATGAARWDIKKRAAFANDPLNLLPADASANRQKGDGDAATWLPAYKPFRCAYVARQVAVKQKYGLWVTAPERDAVTRVLAVCPDQALPVDRWAAPTRVDHDITDPGAPAPSEPPRPTSTRSSQPSSQPSPQPSPPPVKSLTSTYFKNCDAARAAGAAPVHSGDPGYGRHLDRDGDGVGCE
ncbi:excalibur calcium-binding domain-containing protein [Nocardioides jensenii]|uniref:excalibur calcium-binding domain-containing protein n=1 Tax=Nocardioides jensenii TaxID=1843 RepID=UPI00082CBB57|nr:excalibur calcium-binding domain-containing protein [Nocardioides jensenii]